MVELIEKVSLGKLFKIIFDDITPFEEFIEFLEKTNFSDKKDIVKYIERNIRKIINDSNVDNSSSNRDLNYSLKNNKNNMYLKFLALMELGKRIYRVKDGEEYIYTPYQLYKKYYSLFQGKKEKVWCFYFNVKQKLLGKSLISMGSSDFAIILIKDILIDALKYDSKGLIIVHNHPSGDLSPSEQDLFFTKKLKKICKEIGFILLDHIIVTDESYYSMKEKGDLY